MPNFVKRLMSARGSNVAHGGKWDPGDGRELFILSRGVWWVLTTCIVRELGYSETDAASIVKQCSRFSLDLGWIRHLGPEGTATLPPLL